MKLALYLGQRNTDGIPPRNQSIIKAILRERRIYELSLAFFAIECFRFPVYNFNFRVSVLAICLTVKCAFCHPPK